MFEYNSRLVDTLWDVTTIIAIVSAIAFFIIVYASGKPHLGRLKSICDTIILICMLTTVITAGVATVNRIPTVNMNQLDSQIHVDGAKITIDPLPEGYEYNFFSKFYTPSEKKSNIFRFEQDEFYGTTRLIAENGSEFKLSDDDTKFLKERGAKNG